MCLAIAHYSQPTDLQLLFAFEYVGEIYHNPGKYENTLFSSVLQSVSLVSLLSRNNSKKLFRLSLGASKLACHAANLLLLDLSELL